MAPNKNYGFTLIELLVVISIIGLLSSIVMTNLSSSKDKARLAAGIQMSSTIARAYSAEDSAAIWHFDESSGNALDSSGNDNTAAIQGSAVRVEGIMRNAFQFNGTSQYLSTSKVINVNGSSWTLAAWVKPIATSACSTCGNKIFLTSSNAPYVSINNGEPYVLWYDSGNAAHTIDSDSKVTAENWYFIAVTHKDNNTVMYINGKEVKRDPSLSNSRNISGYFYIGCYAGPRNYFGGLVDEVGVYTQSFLAQDIREMYLAGVEKHKNPYGTNPEIAINSI